LRQFADDDLQAAAMQPQGDAAGQISTTPDQDNA
jgi:hypothetical protein